MVLFCMASLHLPYESRTPMSVPLVGQGWAQAASLWAFCLRVHRVGSSIGVVGSPPRQAASGGLPPRVRGAEALLANDEAARPEETRRGPRPWRRGGALGEEEIEPRG